MSVKLRKAKATVRDGDSNRFVPFDMLEGYIRRSNAPTSTDETYAVGDIIYNSSPIGGGYIGWVCVTAGSPGVWKGFGKIEE